MRVHAQPFASRRKPRRRLPPLSSHVPACGHEKKTQMKKPARGGLSHFLAERTGLEPATPGVTGRYSNRLNYRSSLASCLAGVGYFLPAHRLFERRRNLASPRGFEPLYSP
ncbi:conserved hypothetical protein [Burkholderia vietnamiensis]|nr:conserved hypothetical protein [Burkholderia vietnamiensis]